MDASSSHKLSIRHSVVDAIDDVLANDALGSGRELLDSKAGLDSRQDGQNYNKRVEDLHIDRDSWEAGALSSDNAHNASED